MIGDKEIKLAACMFLYNDKGQVLLVNRRNSTEVGLPGGKVDPGENVWQAAIRELREETGIQIPPWKVFKEEFSCICDGEVQYKTTAFILPYTGDVPGGKEVGIQSRWGDFSELLTNSPFKEYNIKLICVVLKHFIRFVQND